MSDKIVLTKEKIEKLKEELKALEEGKKKELSSSLEQARLSDVSEDTDDIIAVMSELQKVEQDITEIKDILENAIVLDKKSCDKNKVSIGSEIKVQINGKSMTFHIVSEVETDPSANKISDKSPLGKELVKASVGDIVKVKVAGRVLEYKVLDIC